MTRTFCWLKAFYECQFDVVQRRTLELQFLYIKVLGKHLYPQS